jgi:hypothetical protein
VAAGGVNSYFTIDATRVAGQSEEDPRGLGRITADTWACGLGIWGGLGNGRWTHVQGIPTKIKALSGLFEYDETTNKIIPIRLAHLSVGSTHMSAIMSNVTYVGAHDRSSENDTNWGADILFVRSSVLSYILHLRSRSVQNCSGTKRKLNELSLFKDLFLF